MSPNHPSSLPQTPDPPSSPAPASPATAGKKPQGFAAISPERRREITRKGGKAAHAMGTAHQFTPEEARVAGRKGGQAVHAKRKGQTA